MTEHALQPTARRHVRDVIDVLDAYRATELATMSRDGVPITWPAVADVDPESGKIVLTTSISFPQKAFNIRRDPRVALLFSDPTGSGRTDLPQVLIRGTATCPDRIHPGTDGLERYWRRLAERQPASRQYGRNAIARRLFDWYYMRLVITVTPQSVTLLDPAPAGPMTTPPVDRADRSPFGRLSRELPGFDSAVLGTAAAGRPPVLRRVRLRPDPASGTFLVDGPDLTGGPASLLLHRHDEFLWNQRQIGVVGQLGMRGDEAVFQPDRLLPILFPSNPVDLLRIVRRARGSAATYLARRDLARPTIDWAAHRACERAAG